MAEKTAFTICANNYLAHASSLAKSFKRHHPEVHFSIAIVDTKEDSIDYSTLGADSVIWVNKDLECDIDALSNKYSIAELCTVVKPDLIQLLFDKGYDQVLYLDPDILVYSYFTEVFEALEDHDIVLTPHICSPTPDGTTPSDHNLMRTGVYNLGFGAFKDSEETRSFISWWDKRVKAFGFHNISKGYFFDQIWLMYAPAFISKTKILRHPGYNAANWNLHERTFAPNADGYRINDEHDLRFFHFSHFKIDKLPELASYNKSYNLDNRKDIVPIFMGYKEQLMANGFVQLKKLAHHYGKPFMDNAQKKELEKKRSAVTEPKVKKSLRLFKEAISTLLR